MEDEEDDLYNIRAFVYLYLESVAYYCRQLSNSVEMSLSEFYQSFSDSGQLLSPKAFNSTIKSRRQQLASSLYYNSRYVAAEVQHYSNSLAVESMDISVGASLLSPIGCQCVPTYAGNFTSFIPCDTFIPWWSLSPNWPQQTCSISRNVALATPINFLFNGTWWQVAMEAANMSSAFKAKFGDGPMEPAVYSSDTSQQYNLYYISIQLFSDSIPSFGPINNATDILGGGAGGGSQNVNLVFDAPSLVIANYSSFFSACAPTTCTYVTYVAPWWTTLVQIGVAVGSIYNMCFLLVYFFPEISSSLGIWGALGVVAGPRKGSEGSPSALSAVGEGGGGGRSSSPPSFDPFSPMYRDYDGDYELIEKVQ